jgi:hypothetical protein
MVFFKTDDGEKENPRSLTCKPGLALLEESAGVLQMIAA